MSPRAFRLSLLCAALFPCFSQAAGLGEVTLLSRIGEPLRAEIPLLAGPGESFDTACFSLVPVRGADLPVITSAKTRLIRSGDSLRLTLTGSKPIAEPIFMIAVQAACGIDLQRDYVLMPQAPLMQADAPEVMMPTALVATSKGRGKYREWTTRQGETLESIAEAQAPGNLAQQRRLLSAIKRANPGIASEQLLAEGTVVRVPDRQQRIAAEKEENLETNAGENRPAPVAPPPKPKVAKARPPVALPSDKAGDRLLLGAADEVIKPVEKRASAQGSLLEVEERMAKLENTIQQLNQEIDKMNAALSLAAQTIEAQQKLQQVQTQAAQLAPAQKPAVQTTSVLSSDKPESGNWLELLLSALGGGAVAVGLASFLSRRKEHSADDEAPLALAGGYRHEVQVRPPIAPQVTPSTPPTPPTLPPAAVEDSALLDSTRSGFSQAQVSEVDLNPDDDNSVLELAEIMLSFGRLRGAADTLALHIEESSPDNIRPWSMLLDLYRRGDMREEFESLAAKMRPKFNVHIPSWEENVAPVSGLKSLEDYAHIVWRTSHSWGTQECLDYLYELTHDNRAGQRGGFPLEVVEEIALLMRVLEAGYGLTRPA